MDNRRPQSELVGLSEPLTSSQRQVYGRCCVSQSRSVDLSALKKVLLLGLCLLYSGLCIADAPRAHIDHTLDTFVTAFNAGDGATVASLYTQDASLLPPDSAPVVGRAAIKDFWQGAIDAGMKLAKLQPTEVESRGDTAYEVGEFTLVVPTEDGTADVHGKYIVVWKRDGHTWQLHRDIWNTTPTSN